MTSLTSSILNSWIEKSKPISGASITIVEHYAEKAKSDVIRGDVAQD
jgi:hypothetical protein